MRFFQLNHKKDERKYKDQYNKILIRLNKAMQHFDSFEDANKIDPEHFKVFLNLIGQAETILMMFPEATSREILFGFK